MKDLNALRTIGEVSQIINVPVYVIRFWEKKFDLININDSLFDNKKLMKMYTSILKGENKLTYKFWTIIMLKAWNNQHLNKDWLYLLQKKK